MKIKMEVMRGTKFAFSHRGHKVCFFPQRCMQVGFFSKLISDVVIVSVRLIMTGTLLNITGTLLEYYWNITGTLLITVVILLLLTVPCKLSD